MNIREQIATQLERLAQEESICILYACESGSRAWGFESVDSDYDVRFIYLYPGSWYLSVFPGEDVIERPINDNLDISGWDLRKALQLLRKSNPPLLEWLQSPIVYQENPSAVSRLRGLIPHYYSPAACHYHYLHMAEGNYRQYLQGQEVWIKKYFYVLRPVLACLWIERGYGVVLTEFDKLVERVVDRPAVNQAIDELLRRKRAGEELDRGPRIPAISDFLDAEIARLTASKAPPYKPTTKESLDQAFLSCLVDNYGEGIR
jgi:predicted nucleotidyltransferase